MGTSQFNPANAGRADFTNLFEELAKARGECADLDARLDLYEAAISQINTDLDIVIEPTISTLKESLRRLIDTGAKNMTVYETAGDRRYRDIPVDLEAGTYHIHFGELDSTDTDGTKCRLEGFLFSQGHDVIISPTTTPVLMNRGEGANIEFVVNSKTDRLRIWAGEDKDASLDDDVSFSDAMVCLQSDYELSPKFVAYVPTLAALYQDVRDIEQEIRTARSGKSSLDGRFDATDESIADEATARQAADEVINTALAGQIDGGSKNKVQTNAVSNAGAWVNIAIDLPAGEYVLFIGNLTSTDTDASTCQLGIFDSSWTNVIQGGAYPQMERGENVYKAVKTTGAAAWLRLYSSDSVAHGSGDTLTATDIMICAAKDWAISQSYAPYCPTMQELYQMILALQSGGASLQSVSPSRLQTNPNALSEAE